MQRKDGQMTAAEAARSLRLAAERGDTSAEAVTHLAAALRNIGTRVADWNRKREASR